MKYIVVGIDDSVHTPHLIDWAAQFATDIDAHITLVHAVPRAELWAIAGVMVDSNKHLEDLRRRLEQKFVSRVRDRGVATDLRVEIGNSAHELIENAKRLRAEFIIIGGPSHGVVHEIVGGHLAHRLAHLSPIPLVVIPRTDTDEPPSVS